MSGTARGFARRAEGARAAATGAAAWLSLAAAPTFAALAFLTSADGAASPLVCSVAHNASPLGGMTAMYLLMSVFHLPPWLRLRLGRSMLTRTEDWSAGTGRN